MHMSCEGIPGTSGLSVAISQERNVVAHPPTCGCGPTTMEVLEVCVY